MSVKIGLHDLQDVYPSFAFTCGVDNDGELVFHDPKEEGKDWTISCEKINESVIDAWVKAIDEQAVKACLIFDRESRIFACGIDSDLGNREIAKINTPPSAVIKSILEGALQNPQEPITLSSDSDYQTASDGEGDSVDESIFSWRHVFTLLPPFYTTLVNAFTSSDIEKVCYH